MFCPNRGNFILTVNDNNKLTRMIYVAVMKEYYKPSVTIKSSSRI